MDPTRAGTGYLAVPDEVPAPGVLVLHSWWGLTDGIRRLCDRLAAAGFVALAPDLFAGATPESAEEAEELLGTADADELAHLTRSGLWHLRGLPVTRVAPAGVLGLSMGASMALWLSARAPEDVAATVFFYGTQDIDFVNASSAYLGHLAEDDAYVAEDDLALLEADLHLLDLAPTLHRYPGTRHWFFEEGRPEHDPEAAELAWSRTLDFLRAHL